MTAEKISVGDLVLTKQFPKTPLLVRNVDSHACDIVYVVYHAGCACYLLASDIINIYKAAR